MTHFIEQIRSRGLLDTEGAFRAEAFINEGKPLEDAVLAADGVSEEALLRYLAETFELPYVDLEHRGPTKEFLAPFPLRVLVHHNILPIEEANGTTLVAVSRISNTAGIDELRLLTGKSYTPAPGAGRRNHPSPPQARRRRRRHPAKPRRRGRHSGAGRRQRNES
ncbi:MAG: hypothetical protein QM754_21300 [Tepidisphaeraceae bacterium]